ncbi:hypothetical protein [Burkholderia sp. Ac-20365]|uniref:hypothetical protein n=1 Tax=Burkholderia sp. Ac-20365 TaxID=2703897 RepID=UPI00197B1413|nr:hypothetical protein [Burkholderia sp. Ac-20365]MBN3761331.1 hypothetical protein [Burkholderia sp. Ac-20365]
MTKLVLDLYKEGDVPQKLALDLEKAEIFKAILTWAGETDLDLHALHTVNLGSGARATSFEDILSTYNVDRVTPSGKRVGILPLAADKTFSIHGGALVHSPDAQQGGDEYIIVNPSYLTMPDVGRIEIPLLAMIHEQAQGKVFRDVVNPRVTILNSRDEKLLEVSLSDQFGSFKGVHLGSIVIEPNMPPAYLNLGAGFNTNFNGVLADFT